MLHLLDYTDIKSAFSMDTTISIQNKPILSNGNQIQVTEGSLCCFFIHSNGTNVVACVNQTNKKNQ